MKSAGNPSRSANDPKHAPNLPETVGRDNGWPIQISWHLHIPESVKYEIFGAENQVHKTRLRSVLGTLLPKLLLGLKHGVEWGNVLLEIFTQIGVLKAFYTSCRNKCAMICRRLSREADRS